MDFVVVINVNLVVRVFYCFKNFICVNVDLYDVVGERIVRNVLDVVVVCDDLYLIVGCDENVLGGIEMGLYF